MAAFTSSALESFKETFEKPKLRGQLTHSLRERPLFRQAFNFYDNAHRYERYFGQRKGGRQLLEIGMRTAKKGGRDNETEGFERTETKGIFVYLSFEDLLMIRSYL